MSFIKNQREVKPFHVVCIGTSFVGLISKNFYKDKTLFYNHQIFWQLFLIYFFVAQHRIELWLISCKGIVLNHYTIGLLEVSVRIELTYSGYKAEVIAIIRRNHFVTPLGSAPRQLP